tara:strand:- start:4577 stop:4801 length:225 start_codon:yes stop_codon:yes gene_type:complete
MIIGSLYLYYEHIIRVPHTYLELKGYYLVWNVPCVVRLSIKRNIQKQIVIFVILVHARNVFNNIYSVRLMNPVV